MRSDFGKLSRRASAWVLVVSSAFATPSEPRTLQETLAYAREHAPRVEARNAERDRVRAEARGRGFWLPGAPSIGGEWADREHSQDRVLDASLALEPFGQGVFRSRVARAARRHGLAQVDAEARHWAAGIAWRYYDHVRRVWLHQRTREQARVTRQLAEVVEQRYAAGDASRLEMLTARVEAAEGERRVLGSERGLRVAALRLAGAMGWPADAALPKPDSLQLVPAFPDTVQLLSRGLERRPELVVARAALERGQAEEGLATARLLPEAELGVFAGREEDEDLRGLRLSLNVPFLGPAVVERGALSAEHRRLAALALAARRDAMAEIVATRAAVDFAHREVTMYLTEILPGIEEARLRYSEAYAIGEVDLTTVLLAEQRYRDAERGFAETLGTYIDVLHDLEVATGLPALSGYDVSAELAR